MPLISKTTFLEFQVCPRDTWLKLHKPELVAQFTPTAFELHLMEEGNEIERVARGLWPNGVLVSETGDEACGATAELMAAKTPAIFQATFVVEGFIAKCDVLAFNAATEAWDLYEIKGTNDKKEGSEDAIISRTSRSRRTCSSVPASSSAGSSLSTSTASTSVPARSISRVYSSGMTALSKWRKSPKRLAKR